MKEELHYMDFGSYNRRVPQTNPFKDMEFFDIHGFEMDAPEMIKLGSIKMLSHLGMKYIYQDAKLRDNL